MKRFLPLALLLSLLLNGFLLLDRRRVELSRPATPPKPVESRWIDPAPVAAVALPSAPAPASVVVTSPRLVVPAPAPVVPPSVTLVASPSYASPKGEITVTCTALSGSPTPGEWIGLYAAGAAPTDYQGYRMITPGKSTYTFAAPRTIGDFEFRYVLADGHTVVATSNAVCVFGDPAATPRIDLQTLTTTVKVGGEIPASWTLLQGPRSPKDWIGLYAPDARNEKFLTWKYVTDADQGRVVLPAPEPPGLYEMRYLLDDGFESVATVRILVVP